MRRTSFVDLLERGALLVALVAVVVVFSLLPATAETFATAANLRFVVDNAAIPMLVALAVTVPLVCNEFDLSVGAIPALSAVVAAAGMDRFGTGPVLAILLAVAVGVLVGALNGLMVARAGISSIVATLGSSSIIIGLLTWYTEGRNVLGRFPGGFTRMGRWPWPLVLLALVSLVLWFVLAHTTFGRRLHAVGSNRRAARLVGIEVPTRLMSTFVVSGLLASTAGVLTVARSGAANPTIGPALLLPALAAAFLGATAFGRGFNVWGTVVGVLLVAVSVSGFTLAGIDPWVKDVINGVLLLGAVAAMAALNRRRGARVDDAGATG